MMHVLGQAHVARNERRPLGRTVAAFAHRFLMWLGLVLVSLPSGTTVRAALSFDLDGPQLRALLARTLAAWERRRRGDGGWMEASASVRSMVSMFRSAVRHGVFPRIAPLANEITLPRLRAAMDALGPAVRLPRCEAPAAPGGPPPDVTAPRGACGPRRSPPITPSEFETLLNGTAAPRARLFLLILGTLAPRIHAVAALRWRDVLEEPPGGGVRTRWCLVEKFGRTRWVFPRPALTEAVTACVHAAVVRPADPLFGRRRAPVVDATDEPPLPSLTSLRSWLSRLCACAGVRRLRPHAFRAFVVNYGVDNGATLEDMARYLGHARVETTARYYWTSDRVHTKVNALFETGSSASSSDDEADADR